MFNRIKQNREDRKEREEAQVEEQLKVNADKYFVAIIAFVVFALFGLYTIVKESYFGG